VLFAVALALVMSADHLLGRLLAPRQAVP